MILIEEAEHYVRLEEYGDAISKYKQAADILSKSGLASQKLDEIYNRISELNQHNTQQKSELSSEINADHAQKQNSYSKFQHRRKKINELQNQAFGILDIAKKEEDHKNYEQSIEYFLQAIEILNKIGWVNETNQIYDEIEYINKKIATENKRVKEQKENIVKKSELQDNLNFTKTKETSRFSPIEFKKKRKAEEKIQSEAFDLIDLANQRAKRKEFDLAVANYNRASVILNSIGWKNYTRDIQIVIQKLIRDKKEYEKEKIKKKIHENIPLTDIITSRREILNRQFELRRERLKKFEENKQKEKNVQNLAFKLIIEGEELVKDYNYDDALVKYNQAVELLISIGWQSQVQLLNDLMGKIHEEKIRIEIVKQQKKKERLRRQSQERILQDQISAATAVEDYSSINIEQVKKSRENSKHIEELQVQALGLIEKANKITNYSNPDYDSAIELYRRSHNLLIEAGWTRELENINQMIESLEIEKVEREIEKERIETLKEKTIQEQNSFQESLKKQMNEYERHKEEQRKKLQEFEEKKEQDDRTEREAFENLNKAKRLVELKKYLEAAKFYQKAIDKFEEIHWLAQIPQIKKEISKMYELNKQLEEEIKHQEEIRIKQQKQLELKKKIEEEQKQKEYDNLMDIKSLIRAVAENDPEQKEEIERKKITYSVKEDNIREIKKNKREMDNSPKEEQMITARDHLKPSIQIKDHTKENDKDLYEKIKTKEDLDEFKKMIKEAAEKSKK